MSLFVSFPFEDRIELLTDGATYLPNGRLVMTNKKVKTHKTVPMAVSGRGKTLEIYRLIDGVLSYADETGSFLDTMQLVEREFDEWRASGKGPSIDDFQLFIAGYIEGYGLAQFQICSLPDYPYKGMEAWRVNQITGPLYAGPDVDQSVTAAILTEERLKRGARDFGPELCQHIRSRKDHHPADPQKRKMHIVGGHIDLTTITANGAVTERLLTWPERLFDFIDPDQPPVIHLKPPAVGDDGTVPFTTPELGLAAA